MSWTGERAAECDACRAHIVLSNGTSLGTFGWSYLHLGGWVDGNLSAKDVSGYLLHACSPPCDAAIRLLTLPAVERIVARHSPGGKFTL